MTRAFKGFIAALAAMLLASSPAAAQASFHESFDNNGHASGDGPDNLVARGWIFRNQSQPRGTRSWFDGDVGAEPPQSGAGYLAVDSLSTDYFGGRVSTWAILPAVPNQRAGDVLTFYALDLGGSNINTLEVRYSPGGGTSTGSGPEDVGDFTQRLLHLDPIPIGGWNRYVVELPGAGRIALRYAIADACNFACFASYTGIDSLSVGEEPPPACNLPPIPAPGQAVTWTRAGSPYRICENISIPPTARVTVEPGVVVEFDQGTQLVVSGELEILATPGDHARFSYPSVFPPMIEVVNGTIDAAYADFEGQFRVDTGANVRLEACEFRGDGLIWMQGLYAATPHVVLDGCLFDNTYAVITDALVELRGNTFVNGDCWLLRGYPIVEDANTFTGGVLTISREEFIQPLLVDGVHASGVADGAGLELEGGNFLLGSDLVLQNNRYTLRLAGGLLPGSGLPLSGNTVNVIDAGDGGFAGSGRWIDLGLPYRLTAVASLLPGGNLTIDPGVTVEGVADAGLTMRSTRRLIAEGLPGQPIRFRAVSQAQPWQGLIFATNDTQSPRLEYVSIEGARFGTISSDNTLYVDNATYRRNQTGANMNSFGSTTFQKTLFTENATGVAFTDIGTPFLNRPATPNAFEGNAAAMDARENLSQADARNVWWGHPTGPQHPNNPSGQGDAIVGPGASGVQFQPFLTERPDFADRPPLVRLLEPGIRWGGATDYLAEQGTKVIIRWEASDDEAIVAQRILFSPDGHYASRFQLVTDDLSPDQRSYEWTVPDPGFAVTNQPQFLRIIAVDSAGQEGWDQTPLVVPSGRLSGDIEILTDLSGQTFYGGGRFPVVRWRGSVNDFPSILPFIILEGDGESIQGLNINGEGHFFADVPHISTDTARLAIRASNNSNDVVWFFADGYFSIRHDPRLGLVPPQVELLTPPQDSQFPGGSVVPISWSASDDEGLYSFDIQASTDGGRTWHMVARDLPSAARDFAWRLPPSTGVAGVRVRVVARDVRFQNNSTGAQRTFDILPGDACPADIDGDGEVDVNDFFLYLDLFAAGDPRADFTGDGTVDVNDFFAYLDLFAAGC